MTIAFAAHLEALSCWRSSVRSRLDEFGRFLAEHDLATESGTDRMAVLRQRLTTDKVVVAFVAEYSRGKSELINAIFFADTGRRVLPAAPGRTTMCPVELAYDAGAPASLSLLPIETRLSGASLAELRHDLSAWTQIPLAECGADQLCEAMAHVTHTRWASQDEACALGFWNTDQPGENPPVDAHGRVEIPLWRHALINYPHPLLQRGLVVLDTPGLNALGVEPELTLGLLPGAHATVFMLSADVGVTRSDLALWQEHLGPAAHGHAASPSAIAHAPEGMHSPTTPGRRSQAHYVVLNKIDTLRDPLLSPSQVGRQIEAQRQAAACTLDVDPECVFALSAREALTARIAGDEIGLRGSRLLALEGALGERLLGQRQQLLQDVIDTSAQQLRGQALHRLGERRRQLAEQMQELRGLRGKSSTRLRAAHQRVAAEAAEFEQCVVQIQALRAVHHRLLGELMDGLASERIRIEVTQMQRAMAASLLNLGARKAFVAMCRGLHALIDQAQARSEEIHTMLAASHARLNAEYAFGLALDPMPPLLRFVGELDLIERSYVQYLSLNHALRLSQPHFMAQFVRMLVSKLRVVFETASSEVELWNRNASAQLERQLGERRGAFRRRDEALARVQHATGELEQRLAELAPQDARLRAFGLRVEHLARSLASPSALTSAVRPQTSALAEVRLPMPAPKPHPPQPEPLRA